MTEYTTAEVLRGIREQLERLETADTHPLVSDLRAEIAAKDDEIVRLRGELQTMHDKRMRQAEVIADLHAERAAWQPPEPVVLSPDWLEERCDELLLAATRDDWTVSYPTTMGRPKCVNMAEALVVIIERDRASRGVVLDAVHDDRERFDRFAAAALNANVMYLPTRPSDDEIDAAVSTARRFAVKMMECDK